MNYHIPENISESDLNVVGLDTVQRVRIKSFDGAKKIQCYQNVIEFISKNGGGIEYGWIFSKLNSVILKLHAHTIVKRVDGSLICVTPPEIEMEEILFASDSTVFSQIINDRLPTKAYALVNDSVIEEFVRLENRESEMRLKGNLEELIYISGEKFKLFPQLMGVVNKYRDLK